MNKKLLLLGCIISSLGYANETEIKLDDTVVVSTTGFETNVRKIVSNPTVVTSKEIQEKGYKSVLDVLEDMPSVNVMKNTFGAMIDLRGQGGTDGKSGGAKKNVQILVDGIAINSLETSMTSTPINTISVDSIERIEVIPGSGAVLYGSGTAGGVVNIITKKGVGTRASVGYDFTSFGGHKTDVAAGHTVGKFDIDVAYSNNEANGYRDDSKDDSEYFQGKVRYDINDDHNLEFKYSNYNALANLLNSLTKEELDEDRNQGQEGRIDTLETTKDDYSLTYNGKLADNLEANVIVYKSETKMSSEITRMEMGPMRVWQEANFLDEKEGVKAKLKYKYGEDNSLIGGVDYIENSGGRYLTTFTQMPPDYKPVGDLTAMDLNKDTLAGFIMNNYKIGNFEFNQGVRYEKSDYSVKRGKLNDSYDEDNYAVELSGNYLYSDTGKTYLRLERGFTSPAPGLLTNKDVGGDYEFNNLKSETYDGLEFGMSDFVGNTAINLSVFYQKMNDEIYTHMSGDPSSGEDRIHSYNIDETARYGAELKLEQYLGKLTLSQSFQYINAEIDKGNLKEKDINNVVTDGVDLSGNKIAGVAPYKFNLGARYEITPKLSLGGEVVYNGSSYLDNENKYGKQEAYAITNLRVNYNADNGLSLQAGINNLLDKEYETTQVSTTGVKTYDPAAGRNFFIGFDYSL